MAVTDQPKRRRGRPSLGPRRRVSLPLHIADEIDSAAAMQGITRDEYLERLVANQHDGGPDTPKSVQGLA